MNTCCAYISVVPSVNWQKAAVFAIMVAGKECHANMVFSKRCDITPICRYALRVFASASTQKVDGEGYAVCQ